QSLRRGRAPASLRQQGGQAGLYPAGTVPANRVGSLGSEIYTIPVKSPPPHAPCSESTRLYDSRGKALVATKCELTIHSACFGPYALRVFLGVTSWSSSRYLSTTVATFALTR